jgi:DNA-binding response OmpR family regulator
MPRIGAHLPPAVAQPTWAKRSLDGVTILIVENEPLIRLHLEQIFREAGASVLSADSTEAARCLAENFDLSGAVLDWSDAGICECLTERSVPFLFYSARAASEFEGWQHLPMVSKAAPPEEVIAALARLLRGPRAISNSQVGFQ